jgi:hypothetical protein
MKLEAVVVCVKFNSWLAWTLPVNRQFFDKLVVVTSTKDTKTQLLCHYWQVPCIPVDITEDFPFNKGRMINEGLKTLDGDGWVLQLDADIMLPPKFRNIMNELDLDQNGLYGADRLMVKDMKEWLDFWLEPELIHECNTYLHLTSFPVGSRIVKLDSGGWLPNGYFHLWHQGTKKLSYPTTKEGASLDFAKGFERKQRHMLAEIAVLHLGDKVNHADIQWNKVPHDEVLKPLCFGGDHAGSG